ncbi:MAG: hypothetical protein IT381_03895 [Deltaproteobacteria bacterium]|nr:hypothetical protein [Deltaproteobacteria bacterium]
MGRTIVAAILLAACDQTKPLEHVVYLAPDAKSALGMAAEDLQGYLARMQKGEVTISRDPPPEKCTPGKVQIILQSEKALDDNTPPGHNGYAWRRASCGGVENGQRIYTYGTDTLAEQYVVYEILHMLGARFYHPEDEWLPPQALRVAWRQVPDKGSRTPPFRSRSISTHTAHPIELLDPLAGDEGGDPYVKRWIDWNVKNGHSETSISGERYAYAKERGFRFGTGFNLVETQQGGVPLLNPDDPRSEEQIMKEAIDARLNVPPEDKPSDFDFLFNPSEFTEEDDRATVRRMTFITNYITQNYPDIPVTTIVHGTAGKPTRYYGVRYYDLPVFAPKELGMRIHTLMFYDLFRPAPVYGNENFHHLYDLIEREASRRRIQYFPENAWWLTFDLPVPLYLPVTMEARSYDIQHMKHLLTTDDKRGIVGHHTFGTGQEWGYWQQDWCVARMTFDLAFKYEDCVEDIAAHTSAPKIVQRALQETIDHEVDELIWNAEFVKWLVGTDEETEIAFAAGIVFHPLPPGFRNVLGWSQAQVDAYRATDREHLLRWETKFAERAAAVTKALKDGDRIGAEIRDGIAITGLRGAHMRALMDATTALVDAKLQKNPALIAEARAFYDEALAITDQAREVVARREAGYRYPLEWSIPGDEPGTPGALKNRTIYPYRYLSRTHRLFFWTRHNGLVDALFSTSDKVQLSARMLEAGEALSVSIADLGASSLSIDFGDGTSATTAPATHSYAGDGIYALRVQAAGDLNLDDKDSVAVVDKAWRVPVGDLRVPEPPAAAILSAVLPGLVVGFGTDGDGEFVAFAPDTNNDGEPEARSLVRLTRAGDTTAPVDVTLPLVNGASSKVIGAITLSGMSLGWTGAPASALSKLTIAAALSTDEIILTLVKIGGFDEPGARKFVASFLGYSEAKLPAKIDVKAEATNLR